MVISNLKEILAYVMLVVRGEICNYQQCERVWMTFHNIRVLTILMLLHMHKYTRTPQGPRSATNTLAVRLPV